MLRVALTWLVLVVLAMVLSVISGYNPVLDVNTQALHAAPSAQHLLGTDHLGRDVFARLFYATRMFCLPGLLAALVCLLLAVPAAAFAGFSPGVWRQGFLATNALLASVPRFVVVLLVASIFGCSSLLLAVVTGVVFVPVLGDAVYARIDQLRVQGFVRVQRAHGISEASILWRHLVWAACRRLIAVNLVHLFAFYLVLECTLSYIGGLGIQEPLPSWGNMMAFEWGRSDVHLMASLAPTLTLWVTMAALAIVAGSVEDER